MRYVISLTIHLWFISATCDEVKIDGPLSKTDENASIRIEVLLIVGFFQRFTRPWSGETLEQIIHHHVLMINQQLSKSPPSHLSNVSTNKSPCICIINKYLIINLVLLTLEYVCRTNIINYDNRIIVFYYPTDWNSRIVWIKAIATDTTKSIVCSKLSWCEQHTSRKHKCNWYC